MRAVTLSKPDFDDFLYPAFGHTPSENEEQLEISARLKFKFLKYASYEHVSAEDIEAARARGGRPVPFLKLNSEAATIELEEDEYRLVVERMKKHISRIPSASADDYYQLLKYMKDIAPMQIKEA